jgi:hypothetical protein
MSGCGGVVLFRAQAVIASAGCEKGFATALVCDGQTPSAQFFPAVIKLAAK